MDISKNEITGIVIGAAIEVHSALGPGLLERAYSECLAYKLRESGIFVETEKSVPLIFEDVELECGYRVDLLVEGTLVVEIKSVASLSDVHLAQTINYMKLGNYKIGLLINFNVVRLKDGIKRLLNGPYSL
ncbi:GxxExxY protein [Daejeonella lutea]|uniref:GxxExxY protein n=1 Tax=Daejeonella lutea TaxID=572036 RepID=A0A1T5E721_9SPHI|nr:GxxExxY protein [Daejeonella lutea]SKB79639.1 GxxExxY protein [Daejeonella lutea]